MDKFLRFSHFGFQTKPKVIDAFGVGYGYATISNRNERCYGDFEDTTYYISQSAAENACNLDEYCEGYSYWIYKSTDSSCGSENTIVSDHTNNCKDAVKMFHSGQTRNLVVIQVVVGISVEKVAAKLLLSKLSQ